MVFDRYEGKAKDRCVFTEHFTTGRRNSGDSETFSQQHENIKFGMWRGNLALYLGTDPGVRDDGGWRRFDLPPHQIRIKSTANDTELPKLEYDFQRREISFQWQGMFTRFFREKAVLEKLETRLILEALEWIKSGDFSVPDILARSNRDKVACRTCARDTRRKRIKEWYLENYGWEYKDSLFEEEEENKALDAIDEFELYGDFERCEEDPGPSQMTESQAETYDALEMAKIMRTFHGPGETDNALLETFMEILNGLPGDDEADDSNGTEGSEWTDVVDDDGDDDADMLEGNQSRSA
jgi:hypothetical protein